MSKIDKLIRRFLITPNDFTYTDLVKLLAHFKYTEVKTGKTGGSRRAFINKSTKHIIRLHKPRPSTILKMYQIKNLVEELKNQGLL